MTNRKGTMLAQGLALTTERKAKRAVPRTVDVPEEVIEAVEEAVEEPEVTTPEPVVTVEAPPAPVAKKTAPRKKATPTPAPQASGDALQLAIRLTSRKRRDGTKPARATISCSADLLTRIEEVSQSMGTDPRLGPGLHPLNRGALLTEAALRYTANPGQYPPDSDDTLSNRPPYHGNVPEPIWEDMKTTWWNQADKAYTFGPHVNTALSEIITELESLYVTRTSEGPGGTPEGSPDDAESPDRPPTP